MNTVETTNADWLVITAVITSDQLAVEIKALQRQRRKIDNLLDQKQLTQTQRAELHLLLQQVETRNHRLYGSDEK